jgi:hypothetical protein
MTRNGPRIDRRPMLLACALVGLCACDRNTPVELDRVVHVDGLNDDAPRVRTGPDAAVSDSGDGGGATPNEPVTASGPPTASPSSLNTPELPLQTDFQQTECPSLDLNIDMRAVDEYETDRGVLIKVLTRPEFTEANRADPEMPRVPPANWDRAEFPKNACVVRVRGIDAECYTNDQSMALYEPTGDGGTPVGQASYHARRWVSNFDLCDWPVPGCPRSEWGSFRGYWWYLTPRADDALLVACAPSCEGFFRAPITLQLRPDGPTGLCDEE